LKEHQKKLGLDQAILHSIRNESEDKIPLDKTEINNLLKYGAYDIFREDLPDTSTKYDEQDIEKILERSSRTVVHNTARENPDAFSSTFSKASFVSSKPKRSPSKTDLDVNDPNFWKKLFPDSANAPDPNIQVQPRQRKQTQRFGIADDAEHSELSDSESSQESSEEDTKQKKGYNWTIGERSRFKSALMKFGYGRWKEIQETAKLQRWSLEYIHRYCKAFLRRCAQVADMEEDQFLANIVDEDEKFDLDSPKTSPAPSPVVSENEKEKEKTDSSRPNSPKSPRRAESPKPRDRSFKNDNSLKDPKFEEYLIRNVKKIQRQLECAARINDIVHNCKSPEEVLLPADFSPDPPATWWTYKDDQNLIFGSYIYGFGQYNEMRVATELGFLGRVEPPEIKKEEKKAEVKVEEKLDIKIDEKSEVKHEEKDMLPPSVPEKVDDEHLSKQEIVEMDVDLTVKKEKDGVIPMDVEKSILYPWPVSKILNQRVRKLLKAIETQKKTTRKTRKNRIEK